MSRSFGDIPRQVFIDTSAYYAIADPGDVDATVARQTLQRLISLKTEIVTTNFIVAELHALLVTRGNPHIGRRVLATFERSRQTTVVRATEEDEQRAVAIVLHYVDKDFSLTDAISFAVMERLGITHAFTFDRHFRQFGWQIIELSN